MFRAMDGFKDIGRIKSDEKLPPGPPIPVIILEVPNVGHFRISDQSWLFWQDLEFEHISREIHWQSRSILSLEKRK
jgi:hypothetical protein